MAEPTAIDYFECPDRGVAGVLLANLAERLRGAKTVNTCLAVAAKALEIAHRMGACSISS